MYRFTMRLRQISYLQNIRQIPFSPENELMEIYGVSRTTIRNAVNLLRDEHIVEVHQGRGTRVLQSAKYITPYKFLSVKIRPRSRRNFAWKEAVPSAHREPLSISFQPN